MGGMIIPPQDMSQEVRDMEKHSNVKVVGEVASHSQSGQIFQNLMNKSKFMKNLSNIKNYRTYHEYPFPLITLKKHTNYYKSVPYHRMVYLARIGNSFAKRLTKKGWD